jgi:toxin ParE1/3/4
MRPADGRAIITPEAEADVDEAWNYLSRRNLKAADRLVDQFLAAARSHAQFPLTGEPREDVAPGLRCFVVRPYVAYYRVEGEDIRILRFLHGRRDVRQVMGRELDEQ